MAKDDVGQARLDEIQKCYDQCFENRMAVLSKCKTDDQRAEFMNCYADLRALLTGIVADQLKSNNASVKAAHNDLIAVNKKIKSSLEGLQDIVAFLGLLSKAVSLASTIVALGA